MKTLEDIVNITIERAWLIIDDFDNELSFLPTEDQDFIWGTAELFGIFVEDFIKGKRSLSALINFSLEDYVMERFREVKRIWKTIKHIKNQQPNPTPT